jgi:hypothetical protein
MNPITYKENPMPTEEILDFKPSTQDKTLIITCAVLVASYVGFALNARRQLKKSVKASDAMYQETTEKIQEIVDIEKQK